MVKDLAEVWRFLVLREGLAVLTSAGTISLTMTFSTGGGGGGGGGVGGGGGGGGGGMKSISSLLISIA